MVAPLLANFIKYLDTEVDDYFKVMGSESIELGGVVCNDSEEWKDGEDKKKWKKEHLTKRV